MAMSKRKFFFPTKVHVEAEFVSIGVFSFLPVCFSFEKSVNEGKL
jgi:hypothetical protein